MNYCQNYCTFLSNSVEFMEFEQKLDTFFEIFTFSTSKWNWKFLVEGKIDNIQKKKTQLDKILEKIRWKCLHLTTSIGIWIKLPL